MQQKNKIGIDISQLKYGFSGITNYIHGLTNILKNTDIRLLLFKNSIRKINGYKAFSFHYPFRNFKVREFWDNNIIVLLANMFKINAMIFPYFSCPQKGRFKKISVIYDLSFLRSDISEISSSKYFKNSLENTLKNADAIITISKSVKEELKKEFSPKQSILVLYPFIETEKHLVFEKDPNVFLCLGTVEKRKNPFFVIDCFKRIHDKNKNAKLIFAGSIRKNFREYFEQYIKELHLDYRENIIIEDHVDEIKKAELLSLAGYTFYLSSYEGFGIPIIEAMSYQCIPIVTDIPVFKETGGDACIFVDINKINDLKTENIFNLDFQLNMKKKMITHLKKYNADLKDQIHEFRDLIKNV